MDKTCGTCRWWDNPDEKVKGRCRRNPPQATVNLIIYGIGWASWGLPDTRFDDWCGEHQDKEPPHAG